VVVLKPAMLGGLLRCVSLAETVRAEGAEGVVSHLFDGPVGLTVACELALALGSTRAAGLAPHAALDAWPEPERPTALSSGRLHAHSRSGLGLERGGEGTG
jgi:L-alanine-DL-glutamate epimerase-like enolase superfamily enzyme